MISTNDIWSRHGDLKQVKVSSVQPTQIGWKYRNDDKEYFTERNVFRITHDFVCHVGFQEAAKEHLEKNGQEINAFMAKLEQE